PRGRSWLRATFPPVLPLPSLSAPPATLMPDPDRLVQTLRRAAQHNRHTPHRRGRLVELRDAAEVLAAGDLHGNLENFRQLLRRADLGEHPRRHFALHELV